MSAFEIERYQPSLQASWDSFVERSRNGTFLFLRDYMDYHRERFADHSLIVRDGQGRIIALLPAHADGSTLTSHGGLTYGGFVVDELMKTPRMLELFEHTIAYLRAHQFEGFLYKTVPHIYHKIPTEEDRYALFLAKATVVRRGVLAVIANTAQLPFQERRRRAVKRAEQTGVTVRQTDDFATYWGVLTEVIGRIYGCRPVHSLEEIDLLRQRFPSHIRLIAAFREGRLIAGVVIYDTPRVAHTQYIAANDEGRARGALDAIFHHLIREIYAVKPFFDFGPCDEKSGWFLNRGLIDQKEGFGARAVMHEHYFLDVRNCPAGLFRRAFEDGESE